MALGAATLPVRNKALDAEDAAVSATLSVGAAVMIARQEGSGARYSLFVGAKGMDGGGGCFLCC